MQLNNKTMDKHTYLIKLSKLIAVRDRVDVDKLIKIIELTEKFYNNDK